jgi:hypothetical protein
MIIDCATPITMRDRHKRSSHPTTGTDNSRPMSDGTQYQIETIPIGIQPTFNQRNSTETNRAISQNS